MDNWRAAQIANTVARVNGGKTKLADFLPQINQPVTVTDTQTKDEQIAILNAVAAGANKPS